MLLVVASLALTGTRFGLDLDLDDRRCRWWCPVAVVVVAATDPEEEESSSARTRIAVIGGGISGSFVTKYLTDYDTDCSLDITVFDPPPSEDHQGSRVASHVLPDGTVVEKGAFIVFGGNRLVNEMIEGSVAAAAASSPGGDDDDDRILRKTKPHSDGVDSDDPEIRTGLGVFDGIDKARATGGGEAPGKTAFPILLNGMTVEEQTSFMLWRYNLDLYRIDRATKAAAESFDAIYGLLSNTDDASSFFDSPNDIWEALGLSHLANVSFADYLEEIGAGPSVAWWRRLLEFSTLVPQQGIVGTEFYEPINICNNNQVNAEMTALAGLVNSAASSGALFAVEGGNDRLIESAFWQASKNREKACSSSSSTIKHNPTRIQTLVSSDFRQKIELFDTDGKVVDSLPYDLVVVATPLQFSGIEFMGKGSVFDESTLYYLPLNEMVDGESSDANLHQHIHALGGDLHLPSSAKRPYTDVVTTFVARADLQPGYFFGTTDGGGGGGNGEDALPELPRSILLTKDGRDRTGGISSIGQITRDVYKVFSSSELSETVVREIFGAEAYIEHVTVWGGPRGGATPAFAGAGEASRSTEFLLYNGGRLEDDNDIHRHVGNHAIYYTNAMESAVSAIEIAAIGAKSVAKLLARRLGLVTPSDGRGPGDEL